MRRFKGIIPARAGFTGQPSPCCTKSGDHPRSRGVYRVSRACESLYGGSSPLARGLRRLWASTQAGRRIIPARAGFTARPGTSRTTPADHPRSRGVYDRSKERRRTSYGSSPLARGLRLPPQGVDPGHRIIPARAGFTLTFLRITGRRADHPRSRGVYRGLGSVSHETGGSSPLARGLRHATVLVSRSRGIIPARAGFTRRLAGRRR